MKKMVLFLIVVIIITLKCFVYHKIGEYDKFSGFYFVSNNIVYVADEGIGFTDYRCFQSLESSSAELL